MNVSPNTGFMRKSSKQTRQRNLAHSSNLHLILSPGIAPGFESVAQLVCLFQETTRASILGAGCLGVFLSVLTARLLAFENTIASCFAPKCWVGFLSVVRVLSLECVRIVAASLAVFSNQLSGHDRFEVVSTSLTPQCGPQGTDFTISHVCVRGLMSVDTRK